MQVFENFISYRRREELKKRLLEIHPYETPEIVRIDIADGSFGYLSWIKEVTK